MVERSVPLLRLDQTYGSFQMVRELTQSVNVGDGDGFYANGIKADAAGNLYIIGQHYNRFKVANTSGTTTTVPYEGATEGWVGRFTKNGLAQWINPIHSKVGDDGRENVWGLAIDGSGNCYVTGEFSWKIKFGGNNVQLENFGDKDIFIASYNADGIARWAQKAGGSGGDVGFNIAVDNTGNVYITGFFESLNANIGGVILENAGHFLASYTDTGVARWGQRLIGFSSYFRGYNLHVAGKGTCYLVGYFTGDVSLPNGTILTSVGSSDIITTSYNKDGGFQAFGQVGGTGEGKARGIVGNTNSFLYLIGDYSETISFPACTGSARTLTNDNSGGRSGFIARMARTCSSVVNVLSPANGATGVNANAYVTATPVEGANTYIFEVSTVADFTGGRSSLTTSGGEVNRTVLFQNLTWNQKYYVRVKTNLSDVWSIVKSFTTGSSLPFTYLSEPANDATGVNTTFYATANVVANATTYTVQLSMSRNFTSPIEITKSNRSFLFNGLLVNTTYYSRVKTDLSPDWGPVRSFTTGSSSVRWVTNAENKVGEILLPVEEANAQIQPNPFSGQTQVRVNTSSQQPLWVTVTNVQGRQLKHYQSQTNTDVAVGATLRSGVYLLHITYGQQVLVKKIIKQ